jgi:hypothetical protein
MDRRTFIKISSGTLAAAGISNILRAQEPEKPEMLYFKDATRNIEYTINYYPSAIRSLGNAELSKKIIMLKVMNADKVGEYAIELNTSSQMPDSKDTYALRGGEFKLKTAVPTLPSDFPERFSAEVFLSTTASLRYMTIKKSDGKSYVRLAAPPAVNDDWEDDYYGCFLTTACVTHKGLPDHCYELETLRTFRDDYMRPLPEGMELVDRYYHHGPRVVGMINRSNHASAIYDHIYDTLVLPAVAMIEDRNLSEAMTYYRDYVLEMERQLSIN